MIYKYENRYIVSFKNGSRASYSYRRYQTLLEKVCKQAEQEDEKIWNYYEFHDDECWIYYYQQKDNTEQIIKIDKEDWEKVKNYYWQLNCNGYPQTRTNGQKIFLHRLIMNTDELIDHKDHNPLNNCKSNLKICETVSDNNVNQKLSTKNTSGITGVSFLRGRWRARIQYKGKEYTQWFANKEDAIECRKKWEKEFKGF